MRPLFSFGALTMSTVLFLASSASADSLLSDSLETSFVSDGEISIVLSAGGYRISESPDARIRVRWSVRKEHQLENVDARVEVDGSEATIRLDGPSQSFEADIEIPRHSDLSVRLSAGELTIEDIVGDKDIRLGAGELNIDVGDPKNYSRVEGSVWAGEIDAAPFEVGTGGLFRSFEWTGEGEHELRARIRAGELELR